MKRFVILLVGFLLINISVWIDFFKGKQYFEFGPFQTTALGTGIIIFLAGIYLQYPKHFLGIYKVVGLILFLVGIGLYCINLFGVFISLRDPEINTQEFSAYGKTKNIEYIEDEIFNAIDQRINEDNGEYAYRLIDLVYNSTLHFFDLTNPGKYYQRVPIYENYILFFRSFLPSVTDNYEFCNPYKALERGIGLCSQFSKIIFGILEQNGITAEIYVLSGHVVTEALIDKNLDQRWVLDADLGVVVEYDIETLESNPEIVEEIYRKFSYSDDLSKKIAEIYQTFHNSLQKKWSINISCKPQVVTR
jgi:UPF0716 family protein affecting phage T7 exclusion